MGREIVYCSQCGVRILEKDLAAGRAFTVLDKVFCADCRDQAFTQATAAAPASAKVSAGRTAPPPQVPKSASTAPRAPAGVRSPGISAPPRAEGAAPRTVVKRSNPMPLYIGSAIGVVGIVVLIVIVMSSGSGKNGTGPGGGSGPGKDGGKEGGKRILTPTELAAQKFNDLNQFAATATDPAAVVKRAVAAEKDIVGTPTEEDYRKFRKRWERKVEEAEAAKKIDVQLAQVKTMAKDDPPEFKRHGEILDILQQAEDLAMTSGGAEKVAEVKNLRREVEEPYEAAADAWFEKFGPGINQWMKERDFKAALKIIDKFPEALKLAKIWRINLTKLREDSLKGKAAEEAKAAGKEVAKEWNYYYNIGINDLNLKNYARAKENLLKAESLLPPLDKRTDRHKEIIAWHLLYNIGCIYAIESKDLKGDDQKKAVDSAFEYLGKSAEAGLFGYRCGEREHATAKDHWDKDKDLDSIRSDPRYAEIIKKYAK